MSKTAMKLALEALEEINKLSIGANAVCLPAEIDTAMDALREALASEAIEQKSGIKQVIELYDSPDQPAPATELREQEPVAFEEWLAKQHGDPEEIGFLQALRISYIAGQDSITSPPAQQEPVAFPARKAVEREIERTANPTGMHLNDGKERVALPGGTLRHMLALIDRTPSPPQRKPLSNEEIGQAARDAHIAFCLNKHQTYEHALTRAIEAAHGIKE